MGMGSFNRHIEHFTAEYVGSTDTSGNHGCTGAVNTCIRSLGAAQTKFHNAISLGCMDNAGSFGRNQALMVNNG